MVGCNIFKNELMTCINILSKCTQCGDGIWKYHKVAVDYGVPKCMSHGCFFNNAMGV
jgi:hypothetical protein